MPSSNRSRFPDPSATATAVRTEERVADARAVRHRDGGYGGDGGGNGMLKLDGRVSGNGRATGLG